MSNRSRASMFLAGLMLAVMTAVGCSAGERPAEGPEIDDRAAEVLRAMAAKVSAAQQVTIRATQTMDAALHDALDRAESAQLAASLKRPDRFFARIASEERERRMFFDGQTFSILHVRENFYSSVPMAGDFDQLVSVLEERFNFSVPATDLLVSDPYEHLLREDLESVSYVGEETVGETLCHHISAVEELVAWDVWISVDGHELVKMLATATHMEGAPQIELVITEIDLQASLDDGLFVFAPPPGATEIRMVTVDEMDEE